MVPVFKRITCSLVSVILKTLCRLLKCFQTCLDFALDIVGLKKTKQCMQEVLLHTLRPQERLQRQPEAWASVGLGDEGAVGLWLLK